MDKAARKAEKAKNKADMKSAVLKQGGKSATKKAKMKHTEMDADESVPTLA